MNSFRNKLLLFVILLIIFIISCTTIYIRNFRLHESSRPLKIEGWKIDPVFRALLSFDKDGNEVLSPDTFDVSISFERDLTSRDTIIYNVTIDTLFLTLLPSCEKYKLAVTNEIIWRLDKLRWRKNPSPQNKSILNDSAQERDWAVGAAISRYHIPTIDELESIKNMWLRSIQDVNAHNTHFISNNYPELRYNQSNRTWRRKL